MVTNYMVKILNRNVYDLEKVYNKIKNVMMENEYAYAFRTIRKIF